MSMAPVRVLGNYAHDRYRQFRMPPIERVNKLERSNMYYRRPLNVYNARELDPKPTLSTHGFTLIEHETACSDLLDQTEVSSVLYDEYSDLLLKLTGCRAAKVTQHQYRNGFGGLDSNHPRAAKPTPNGSEGVYGGIHSDVTPHSESGWARLVDNRHFQVFNFWQSSNTTASIQVMPLSLCDMHSVEPEDMICADSWNQTKNPRKLVSYRLAFNPNQKWYYYPNMKPSELLVFKQYDTRQELPNRRCVYHGAIDLPNTPESAPLRETIEVRLLALYEREIDKHSRVKQFQAQVPLFYPDNKQSDW